MFKRSLATLLATACLLGAADSHFLALDLDRGDPGLTRAVTQLKTRASFLMITAHPDDEDGGLLVALTRGLGARGSLMTLTRGEGGQNAMSGDMYDELGLLRTQELQSADRYYGVDQYWGSVIDYGFSKTREEALAKWNHDRVLGEVVRVVRMTRPLILLSVFIGAPTDGHGNHQVAGQMAQEAFLAAGDPTQFPEQIKEGLQPWQPLKVYERVPFFEPTPKGIYDYATDKYVPVRFFDYVNQRWIDHTPEANVKIQEGRSLPSVGLTYLQIGREGLGQQKSQNGGVTIPPPAPQTVSYHRYGSKVTAGDKEASLFEGIDISLESICPELSGDLQKLDAEAQPDPSSLADYLKDVRALQTKTKDPAVSFELKQKEKQAEHALQLALNVTFDAFVAPAHAPTGAAAFFGGPAATSETAIPGQKLAVRAHLYNQGTETVSVQIEGDQSRPLNPGTDSARRLEINIPDSAPITRAYFDRPDHEQPYYDDHNSPYRNLSETPYPLIVSSRIQYRGVEFTVQQVVQTMQRIEGIGLEANPLLIVPPISVELYPSAGAVPLSADSFAFTTTIRSNVNGAVQATLRPQLPEGWTCEPAQFDFKGSREGDAQTINFRIKPHDLKPHAYDIKAVAEYNGKSYTQGFHMVGYPGLRPYPYYRPSTYKAVGVDVTLPKTLRVAFVPGTGDEVPRALEQLGITPRILPASDLESTPLDQFDAIVLGVRAYAVQPSLRASNNRLLEFVKQGGTLLVQYNLQNFDGDLGPYPFSLGTAAKVVDESSKIDFLQPNDPILQWPNKITAADFQGWQEERGHSFMATWDPHYKALFETSDPDQAPQRGGLLVAQYGKGFYIYDAFALYRQLPAGVPGAYRILANLVSASKNPDWK